jgi:hypothetical protein
LFSLAHSLLHDTHCHGSSSFVQERAGGMDDSEWGLEEAVFTGSSFEDENLTFTLDTCRVDQSVSHLPRVCNGAGVEFPKLRTLGLSKGLRAERTERCVGAPHAYEEDVYKQTKVPTNGCNGVL